MAPTRENTISSHRTKRRSASVTFAEAVEILEIPLELCCSSLLRLGEPSDFERAAAALKAPAEGEMPTAAGVRQEEPPSTLQTALRLAASLLGPCLGGDAKQVAGAAAVRRLAGPSPS